MREPSIKASRDLEARFLELLERNKERIGRLCRAFASAADLEDLRSEVALQLWRSLPSFEGRSSEDTWVYRVTLNCALLHRRTRKKSAKLVPLEHTSDPVSSTERPDEKLERSEAKQALQKAIRQLAPVDRAILALHLEQASYAQIAEVLGITESNVGVKLHRAKRRIATILRAEGGLPE